LKLNVAFTILFAFLLLLPNASAITVDAAFLGSAPGRFNSIEINDVDKDGNKEVIFGNYEGYVNMIQWKGGEFKSEAHLGPFGSRLWGIHVDDIDSDGRNEILAGDGEGSLRVFNATNLQLRWEIDGLVRDVHGIAVGDVDNDGDKEIVAGGGYKMDYPLSAVYIINPLNGSIENSFLPGNASRMRSFEIADIDHDSYNELIFGTGEALGETPGIGHLYVYQINGQNVVQEWKSDDLNGDCVSVKVVDVDGDGNLEIITSNGYREGPGFAFIFRYVGSGGEGNPPIYQRLWESENIGPKAWGLDVADIDGDSINEIVIGNGAGYIWIFDGVSRSIEWKSPLLGSDVLGLALGDVDGDGQIEIVAGQGGYQGKADFTSAYTAPHIFVIDGAKHTIEYTLGGRDYTGWAFELAIASLVIMLLIGINIYIKVRKPKAAKEEDAK
jgi:hypothetical protein